MNWYKGGIAEAVTSSKTKGAIFVVYIEGKDEKSATITKTIDSEEIAGKLQGDNFVAIKIEADSLPHQQFSQIYKQTPVPSLYFIGDQGNPLEVITEANDIHFLSQKLDSICEKNGLTVKQTAQNFINTEQASNVVCENDVCTIRPSSSNIEDKKDFSTEEKVERAKGLLEKKRMEKQREEKEKEREKEIERRKVGQNVQQMKKWQEDQELKQLLEERDKERRESQEARNRVLAQIAQDKAERASRFSQPSTCSQQQQSTSARPVANSNTARLQFRLPDGRISTNDFSSSDTLETVHCFIRDNLNLSFSTYTLSTTFPRREFTDEDRQRTLLELQLVPNAVILVLPVSRGVVSTNSAGSGGFNAILWNLLAPVLSIFGFIRNFLFGSPASSDSSTSANERTNRKEPQPNANQRFQVKKRMEGESTVVRRQGNVHGLANRNDSDDDENNTWNGNSTQQM